MKILRFILFTIVTGFAIKSVTAIWFSYAGGVHILFSFIGAILINIVAFGIADQFAGAPTPEELEAEDQAQEIM